MHPRTRLKVCCIASPAEARLAIEAGADALGLVAAMPSGPGSIPDTFIRSIVSTVPPPITTFLLTSQTAPEAVLDHLNRTAASTIQLVDDTISIDVYSALRTHSPSTRIVQVIHVCDRASVDLALALAPHIDALLLDSGNPSATIRELGGTGRTHDWSLSREIVRCSPVPVFLAGGLTVHNIASAIIAVRPFGVDLCSGVRTAGALDPAKLSAFISALHAIP